MSENSIPIKGKMEHGLRERNNKAYEAKDKILLNITYLLGIGGFYFDFVDVAIISALTIIVVVVSIHLEIKIYRAILRVLDWNAYPTKISELIKVCNFATAILTLTNFVAFSIHIWAI